MWLPSSTMSSSHGPFTSRARRSASCHGMMRSCFPVTMNSGQVMFCCALERKRRRILPRFVLRLAVAAYAECFARVVGQAGPRVAHVVRPGERDAGFHPLLERG